MADVIQFLRSDHGGHTVADLLAAYLTRAQAGDITSAIVIVATADDAGEFQISLGDGETNALALIGSLEVAKQRLVRLAEAEGQAES